jgi:hypothetical protein
MLENQTAVLILIKFGTDIYKAIDRA